MLSNPWLKWFCLFTAINYTMLLLEIIWQTSGQFFPYHSNHCASKLLPTFHYPSNHCASMCVVRTASQVDDGQLPNPENPEVQNPKIPKTVVLMYKTKRLKFSPTFQYPFDHCGSMCFVRTASQVDDGYHIDVQEDDQSHTT